MRKFFIPIIIVFLSFLVYIFFQTITQTKSIIQPQYVENRDSSDVVRNIETEETTDNIGSKITPISEEIKEIEVIPQVIKKIPTHIIPFFAQAPTGEWSDPRQQDGCEEATAIMAMGWVENKSFSNQEALREIITLSDFEQKKYGEYLDISLQDIKDWIFGDYYNYDQVKLVIDIDKSDIIQALEEGKLVMLPLNGQKLTNPYFTSPGPERHMVLVRGYDYETDEFITNDPGTRRGENFRYSGKEIIDSVLIYPTGHHEPIAEKRKGMLVISK